MVTVAAPLACVATIIASICFAQEQEVSAFSSADGISESFDRNSPSPVSTTASDISEGNSFSGSCFMNKGIGEDARLALETVSERLNGAIKLSDFEAAKVDLSCKGYSLILCNLESDRELNQICHDLETGNSEGHEIHGVCMQKKLLTNEVQSSSGRSLRSANNTCQVVDNLVNPRQNPHHLNFRFIKQPKVFNLKKAEGVCGSFLTTDFTDEGDDFASRTWDPPIACTPMKYDPVHYLYYVDGNPVVTVANWQVAKAECKPVDSKNMYVPIGGD